MILRLIQGLALGGEVVAVDEREQAAVQRRDALFERRHPPGRQRKAHVVERPHQREHLRERGLVSFTNPQSPGEMLTGQETAISTQYLQLKAGGDSAALMGLCKFLVEWDDAALRVLAS